MSCLTVTFPEPGQYTLCALASVSRSSYRASCAHGCSFEPANVCMRIWVPHVHTADMSGAWPYNTLYGVLPLSAQVAVQFFSHVVCLSASPHNDLGRPLEWVNTWMRSSRVRFRCSAMPFNWGVLCIVNFLAVPDSFRCWSNFLLRNSPPRSDLRTFIALQWC